MKSSERMAVIIIWHTTTNKGNDGRKDKIQRLLQNESNGSMKFITGEDLELLSWQNQGGTSRK